MRLENTLVSTRNIRKGDLTSSVNTSQGQRSLQPPLEADVCLLVVARKFFPPPFTFSQLFLEDSCENTDSDNRGT